MKQEERKTVILRLPEKTHQVFRTEAKKNGRTIQTYLQELIENHLGIKTPIQKNHAGR